MQNVDIEIYFSQFKTFFRENPRELENLIGKGSPEEFFTEVYYKILENNEKGEDLELTQKQIIDVVLKINQMGYEKEEQVPMSVFTKTKFGKICLN
jgi:hypothetical protein